MKKIIFIAALIQPFALPDASGGETREFPAAGLERLEVRTSGGSISVNASTESVVRVQISGDEPEKCLVTVKREDKRLALTAETVRKKKSFLGSDTGAEKCNASFTLAAPPALALRAVSSMGPVSVSGMSGKTDLESGNSAVTVHSVGGELSIKNSLGRVSGDACVSDLKVESGNAPVSLSGLCGPADIKSSLGRVSLDWQKAPESGEIRVVNGNGSTKLYFPEKAALKFSLKSGLGSVKNEFGSGEGPLVTVESSLGSISVIKKR